jgi:hypothetical protein
MCCVRIVGRRVGIFPIIFCTTSAQVGVGVIIPGCCRRGIEGEEEEQGEEGEGEELELEGRGRREREEEGVVVWER